MQMDGYMYQVIDFKENVIYCMGKVQGKDEEKNILYLCNSCYFYDEFM